MVNHVGVVHDLVVAVHRRLKYFGHPVKGLDSFLHTGAETTWRSKKYAFNAHAMSLITFRQFA